MKGFIFISFTLIFSNVYSDEFSKIIDIIEKEIRNKNKNTPLIISITGCSGVGKTTLSSKITESLGKKSIQALILHLDHYSISEEEKKLLTHQHDPRILKWTLIEKHLEDIGKGITRIEKPFVNQLTKEIGTEIINLETVDCILCEGVWAFANFDKKNLARFSDLSFYLETSLDNIYNWKWTRELKKPFSRSPEEFFHHMTHMIEGFFLYVYPMKQYVDYIILIGDSHEYIKLSRSVFLNPFPSSQFDSIRNKYINISRH